MKLYRLLTGPDDATFCRRVTEALNQGWSLHGCPSIAYSGKHVVAAQAIVKNKKGRYTKKVDLASA